MMYDTGRYNIEQTIMEIKTIAKTYIKTENNLNVKTVFITQLTV